MRVWNKRNIMKFWNIIFICVCIIIIEYYFYMYHYWILLLNNLIFLNSTKVSFEGTEYCPKLEHDKTNRNCLQHQPWNLIITDRITGTARKTRPCRAAVSRGSFVLVQYWKLNPAHVFEWICPGSIIAGSTRPKVLDPTLSPRVRSLCSYFHVSTFHTCTTN